MKELQRVMGRRTKIGFLELFLPIYSILMYYSFPFGGSVGQFIFLAYFTLTIITKLKKKPQIPKGFFVFLILLIPLQTLAFMSYGGFNIQRFINLVMIFFYITFLSLYKVNIEGLIKVYKVVAIFASLLIIYHFILIFVYGKTVETILLLPIERPELWYDKGTRPLGLFPEPQVYASFIFPLLVMTIRKKEWLISSFLTFSVALSTSSLGIFGVLLIWGYELLFSKMSFGKILLSFFAFLIIVLFASRLSIFEYAVEKIATTDFEENARLTRGFYIYSLLPTLNKIVGIGVNNVEYAMETGLLYVDDNLTNLMRNAAYITTASELFVKFGLILTCVYWYTIYNLYQNSTCKLFAILLFVLSFGQTILFSGVWLVYMVFLMGTLKQNNNCFLNK